MKNGICKRFFSLLLILTLLVSLCPAAFAEDAEPEEPAAEELFVEEPAEEPELAEEPEPVEEPEEETEPSPFPGLPEGYALSEEELAKKQALADCDAAARTERLVPDVDYIEGEVFLLTNSEEYAELAAAAYGAELKSYRYGVAVLQLHGATTLEAVAAGADMELALPAVEANHIITLEPDWGDERQPVGPISAAEGEEAPARLSWQYWKDYMKSTLLLSVDPYLSDPSDSSYQYMHDTVDSYAAWGVTMGAGVTVAVVDTGVDVKHKDLRDNNTADPIDLLGLHNEDLNPHGTHVAGIVAAELGNGKGGAGIAPEAGLLSVRVLDKDGIGSEADFAAGIRAVIEARSADVSIKVINMSLGGPEYDSILEQVLREAVDAGITLVVAMGNESTNLMDYPAALDIPGLIAVGSVTEAGVRSSFSSYGAWEDVLAPGSAILSSVPDNGYEFMSGTSMATPVVAGVCALYLSVYPDASPAEVEAAVKAAVNNGIVDASKLFAKEQTAPTIAADEILPYGGSITITPGPASDFVIYTVDGTPPAVKNGEVTAGKVLSGGSYSVAVTAENGFAPGKKISIKAVGVSGLGVVSKVAAKSVTVGYLAPKSVTIAPVAATLLAGKSVTLSAAAEPAEANQALVWSITNNTGCPGAKLNAKTGALSTKATDNGTLTVRAASPDDAGVYSELTVSIGKPQTAKKLVPDVKAISDFYVSAAGSSSRKVSVSALDASGKEVEGVVLQWSSSNPKVAAVEDAAGDHATVKAVGKGSATITVKAQDGSNLSASLRVTVKQAAETVTVSGPISIAPGKSANYKAALSPADVSDKGVNWSLGIGAPEGVSIDERSGRVTVASSVLSGLSFRVVAKSKDGYADGSLNVTVKAQTGALVPKLVLGGVSSVEDTRTGALKSLRLFSEAYRSARSILNAQYYKTIATLKATDQNNDSVDVEWSSSNPAVVTVDESGLVLAVGAGSATITCKARDSSGKSAKVSVTVTNPVSGVTVVSKAKSKVGDRLWLLGVGKSAANTAVLSSAFGKPANTKVTWSQRTFVTNGAFFDLVADSNALELSDIVESVEDGNGYEYEGEGITLSANGTVKADKSFSELAANNIVVVWVSATAEDGSRSSGGVGYLLTNLHTKLSLDPGSVELKKGGEPAEVAVKPKGIQWSFAASYSVKSSDPAVAGAELTINEKGRIILRVYPEQKAGNAVITLTATDGSNKSAKLKVKVS